MDFILEESESEVLCCCTTPTEAKIYFTLSFKSFNP